MSARVFGLHGLRVCSSLPLRAAELAAGPCDLHVRAGAARDVPSEIPPGEVIAEAVTGGRHFYVAIDDGEHSPLRYPGLRDFLVTRDLRRVTYRPAPAADVDRVPLACVRVLGWRHHPLLARLFDALVRLATRTLLIEARIPWGPPFRLEIAEALLRRLPVDSGEAVDRRRGLPHVEPGLVKASPRAAFAETGMAHW